MKKKEKQNGTTQFTSGSLSLIGGMEEGGGKLNHTGKWGTKILEKGDRRNMVRVQSLQSRGGQNAAGGGRFP